MTDTSNDEETTVTTTPKTWADVLAEVEGARADLDRAIAAIESRPDATPRLLPAPDDKGWIEVESTTSPSWPKPERLLMLIVFAIGLILGAEVAVFAGWIA